jgi:integrase/recombinase XerD
LPDGFYPYLKAASASNGRLRTGKTYKVTEHLDLGFRPRDKEEETVPIPDLLVDILTRRRLRHPRTRLIFPGRNGKPNGHAQRVIKGLALRAGVNCGGCTNKKKQSCATHPVGRHVLLHKMQRVNLFGRLRFV